MLLSMKYACQVRTCLEAACAVRCLVNIRSIVNLSSTQSQGSE